MFRRSLSCNRPLQGKDEKWVRRHRIHWAAIPLDHQGSICPVARGADYEGDGIRGRRTTRRITSFSLLLVGLLASMTVAPRAAQTSTPVWSGTGPMAFARSLHTAT